jgi:uncharacterized coiled-coil DUF342 family protein
MADKLREIRDTTSDAVSIIRELGSPDVQESLSKILETAKVAREIVNNFKTAEFVKNIENIRLTAESVQDSSMKIENAVIEMKRTGIFDETRETIKSVNRAFDTVGGDKGFGEISNTLKETLTSIRDLVNELKAALATSKASGTARNARDVLNEASEVYKKISDQRR